VICHLCEESTCCPVHDGELYAARVADRFEATILRHLEFCGHCGEDAFDGSHDECPDRP
jgi:hypothetical protein